MSKRSLSSRVSLSMTAWLLLVWVAVFSSLAPLTLLSGLVLALAVQLILPMPSHRGVWHLRIWPTVVLVTRFIWDLVVAGVQVSWLVISGRDHPDGIVECRMRSNNPIYATIVAAMTSMIPGTIVIQIDLTKQVMYLHCLNLPIQGGADGIRQATAAQEERVLLAFGTDQAVADAGLEQKLSHRGRSRLAAKRQSDSNSGSSAHQPRERRKS